MSTPPPRPDDELEATVAMPRVEPQPQPQRRRIDPAVVEPSGPVRVSPSAPRGEPVTGTHIPPGAPDPVRGTRPRFELGSPFGDLCARLFAFLLDVALVSFVVTSLAYSLIAVNPITGLPTNTAGGFDATFALGLAVALVYVWVAEASFGTTIGKLAMGLHVYAVRGGPVGLGRAFLRGLLRPVDLLIVGGVMALLPGRRRLGDLAGGTIVARSPLRRFAPVIGWVLALIVAGVPVILTGWNKTFLSLLAFYQFLPGIVMRIAGLAHEALRLAHLVS